jgi:hypothetical protein
MLTSDIKPKKKNCRILLGKPGASKALKEMKDGIKLVLGKSSDEASKRVWSHSVIVRTISLASYHGRNIVPSLLDRTRVKS